LNKEPANFQAARKYWNKLKERLGKEGSQLVTNCHRFKLPADDGKMRLTDVANAETLLRLVQSVPSPKAEPIKLWLAKVGYERMQEMSDPARALERARATWQQHGRSEKWIQQRMTGQETRNKLTDITSVGAWLHCFRSAAIPLPLLVGVHPRNNLSRRSQSSPRKIS
jgi:predicted membrane chloride channel (bestrophin family)